MKLTDLVPGRLYVVRPRMWGHSEVMRYDPSPDRPTLVCEETGTNAGDFKRRREGARWYCREPEILREATPEEASAAGWDVNDD